MNGFSTQVQTYFSQKASDGHIAVFLLDQFFNQQIFNIVANEIKAGRFSTNALNIALFPNTFIFSLNAQGGVGNCCTLGFHTFFTDSGVPKGIALDICFCQLDFSRRFYRIPGRDRAQP